MCLPHGLLCPIHPQRVDGTSKGNFDTSTGARDSRENRAIHGAAAFAARKHLRCG